MLIEKNLTMRFASKFIGLSELPGEVSLVFSIAGCHNNCKGCHSPHLQKREGEELTIESLYDILEEYYEDITAVCFLGGDIEPSMIDILDFIKTAYPKLKIGLYTGHEEVCSSIRMRLDYLKLGPYIEEYGPLTSPYTNQRFYKKDRDIWIDETFLFNNNLFNSEEE